MATVTKAGGTTVNVTFNLFNLKQRLHVVVGEEVSLSQIAREADLHRNTIERIYNNEIDRIDLKTLAKLLAFFHARGVEIEIGEIFSVSITE